MYIYEMDQRYWKYNDACIKNQLRYVTLKRINNLKQNIMRAQQSNM